LTQEATLLIQRALTEEQPFSWQGEYFSFPTIAVWPRPVQRPFPPMFYSGNSIDSAKFAGAHRLGLCISFLNAATVAETVAVYRAEAAKVGWEPSADQIVYRGFVILADTAEEATRLEAEFLLAATRQNIARPGQTPVCWYARRARRPHPRVQQDDWRWRVGLDLQRWPDGTSRGETFARALWS
jgi:alkanesulfonate monooxygenase SsuD/methylene tetrahydromethanopterin reductase-like flavin-dependent oxidoreductase (luciferase family)